MAVAAVYHYKTLFNMCPSFATQYNANIGLANGKFGSYYRGRFSDFGKRPYFFNAFFSQFGIRVAASNWKATGASFRSVKFSCWAVIASFFSPVSRIVFCGSGNQMLRVYTAWVVALMHCKMAILNFIKVHYEGNSMSPKRLGSDVKLPVSILIGSGGPFPARPQIGCVAWNWSFFINFLPKISSLLGIQLEKLAGTWDFFVRSNVFAHIVFSGFGALKAHQTRAIYYFKPKAKQG